MGRGLYSIYTYFLYLRFARGRSSDVQLYCLAVRGGDIKSLGSYTLAGAYCAFATCIRLVESGEYDSVCIFVWDDGLPYDTIAQFSECDVED